jgi:hypothetical protein
MTDRLTIADARTTNGADFARSLDLRIRTPEQKQAEWDAQVSWYIERILSGCEFSDFGNPQVTEAMKRIALREGDAEPTGDPLLRKDAA